MSKRITPETCTAHGEDYNVCPKCDLLTAINHLYQLAIENKSPLTKTYELSGDIQDRANEWIGELKKECADLTKMIADRQEEIVRQGFKTHIERAEKYMWTHRFYKLHHEMKATKTQDHGQAVAHRELAEQHSSQALEFEHEAKNAKALLESFEPGESADVN